MVYNDQAGRPTIGVGHLLTHDEIQEHTYDAGITREQCGALLAADLAPAERAVNLYITAPISQEQYDSLVSFVFNEGVESFRTSSLRAAINRKAPPEEIQGRFMLWVKVRDPKTKLLVTSADLTKRRTAEAAAWTLAGPPAPRADRT